MTAAAPGDTLLPVGRDRFVDQFWPAFKVHCLGLWPAQRRKEPPHHLAGCFYRWIETASGTHELELEAFCAIVRPVIEELHRTTPRGERPDARLVAGMVYDALTQAGAGVAIRPPDSPGTNRRRLGTS